MLSSRKSTRETAASLPIDIPQNNAKKIIHYELKRNLFNPDKHSPPNSWNSRLPDRFYQFEKRILRDL